MKVDSADFVQIYSNRMPVASLKNEIQNVIITSKNAVEALSDSVDTSTWYNPISLYPHTTTIINTLMLCFLQATNFIFGLYRCGYFCFGFMGREGDSVVVRYSKTSLWVQGGEACGLCFLQQGEQLYYEWVSGQGFEYLGSVYWDEDQEDWECS